MKTGSVIALGCLGAMLGGTAITVGFCAYMGKVANQAADKEAARLKAQREKAPPEPRRPATPISQEEPDAPTAGKWQISTDTSKVDDSKTVTLALAAESAISGWPATTHVPRLILRCQERKTSAYITTEMAANIEYGHSNEARVTLRFDRTPAKTVWAGESTDNKAVFLPGAVGQIRTMAKTERMLFRFTPFNSSPQETEFDLRGLSLLLPQLSDACGWSLGDRPVRPAAREPEELEDGRAYSIQVKVTGDESEAETIAKRLHDKGHVVYVIPATKDYLFYRVRLGIFNTRTEVQKAVERIEAEEADLTILILSE